MKPRKFLLYVRGVGEGPRGSGEIGKKRERGACGRSGRLLH